MSNVGMIVMVPSGLRGLLSGLYSLMAFVALPLQLSKDA